MSIQYEGSSIAATLGGLSAFGLRFEVAPKQLHEVATATQQWDVFLKGLAAGYNNCILSRQQFADGVTRIYSRLKEDSVQLEEVRKTVAQGQKVDARRLQQLIDSVAANLRQFAELSGKEVILERIFALSEQLSSTRDDILNQQKDDTKRTSTYLRQIQTALLESNKPVVAFVPRVVFPASMPHFSDEQYNWEQTEATMRREAARCPPGLDDYPSSIKERSGCDLLILRERSLERNHVFAETLYAGPKLTTTIYFGFDSFDFTVKVVDCKDEFHTSTVQPCLHTVMTSLRAHPGMAPQEKFTIFEMGAGFEAPMTATFVPEREIFENHPTLSRDLLLKEFQYKSALIRPRAISNEKTK